MPTIEPRDPEDLDDWDELDEATGTESYEGNINFAIITSFTDGHPGSGSVWVIPVNDKDTGYALIAGINRPVNTCFDKQNDFLYVVDASSATEGYIYQYSINWDEDELFELKDDSYAVVYKGSPANDCAVDSIGNLYWST